MSENVHIALGLLLMGGNVDAQGQLPTALAELVASEMSLTTAGAASSTAGEAAPAAALLSEAIALGQALSRLQHRSLVELTERQRSQLHALYRRQRQLQQQLDGIFGEVWSIALQ